MDWKEDLRGSINIQLSFQLFIVSKLIIKFVVGLSKAYVHDDTERRASVVLDRSHGNAQHKSNDRAKS